MRFLLSHDFPNRFHPCETIILGNKGLTRLIPEEDLVKALFCFHFAGVCIVWRVTTLEAPSTTSFLESKLSIPLNAPCTEYDLDLSIMYVINVGK